MNTSTSGWDVVGVGANAVDFVYRLPVCPSGAGPFSKLRIRQHMVLCGGQTATAMCACATLGLRVKYVGSIGNDDNGRRVREALCLHAVDASDVRVHDARNQYAVILIDETTGERIVLWDRDERLNLSDTELPHEEFGRARVVHVDDVDVAAAIRVAQAARIAGAVVTSDVEQLTERTEELVASVTIPIFAEHAPAELVGVSDPERALRKLRMRHDGLLCVTLGDRGAMALEGDRLYHSPGFRVEAVDTTGAGDVFRGAFIYALLQGQTVGEILDFANAAAAASCTRVGAMNAVPTLEQIQRLLVENRRTE